MKNNTVLIFAVLVIFTFVLGCGITERLKKSVGEEQTNTNTSTPPPTDLPEKTETNTITPDGEKIGIPQCDAVFDMLTEQMKPKEDETYTSKAAKEFYLNKIRESFRESIKNEKDRDKLAENCTQLLEQLKKHKAEEG